MDDLVTNGLLVTFLLCTLLKSSFNSIPSSDNDALLDDLILKVFESQAMQPCDGDLSKYKCATTPECIDVDLECNGKKDCTDGSDEKESLCKNIPCLQCMFRCDYGACIDSDKRCNGVKDCNDNSDETNCTISNRINTNCRSDQFECSNDGQCIEIDQKCNGKAECKDKSDETEELCFNMFCSRYTFKCKYGACVNRDAECNNIQDCIDNSDEDEKKCAASTPSPLPSDGYGKTCTTPAHPINGQWIYLSDSQKGAVNRRIHSNTVIIYSCDEGYKLSVTEELTLPVVCLATGDWSVVPTCQKLCPSLYNSPTITLTCKNNGSLVPCDKATDYTVLTYKCAPYYEPPHGQAESSTCFDGSWNYIPKCIPGTQWVWESSEIENLTPISEVENFRRQAMQTCNGDFLKFKCATTPECIDGDLECNGKVDCTDGSDEKESLCNFSKKCTSPPHPINGQWTYLNDGRKGTVSRTIPSNTVIIYSCDDGYKLSVTTDATLRVICLPTNDWSLRVLPTCQKLCPSLYNSPLTTLTCMNDGSRVPCDKATDYTVLTYKCAPYYEPPHGQENSSTCYDGSWDYVPTCIPGTLWNSSENLAPSLDDDDLDYYRALRRQTTHQTCNGDFSKFKCSTTHDCIYPELLCNGMQDCTDGSDEKESLCKNMPCPEYTFRCDYGACIDSDKRCNGVKDCNDNSDETNCEVTYINTNCRSDQFQCANGECIHRKGKCNGKAECKDKSDETEELCFNMFCSGYTFKCKYGACVNGDAECNNFQDCIDNSDEDDKKCGPTTTTTTLSPLPSGGYSKECITPAHPINGQWIYLNDGKKGTVSRRIPSSTVIIYSCDDGYKLSITKEATLPVVCLPNGDWSSRVEPITCQKLCPSLYNGPLTTLTCKNDGFQVYCDKATDNTVLTYECAPYYEPPHGQEKSSTCYNGSWDYIPECIPVCGEKRVSATPLIVDGKKVERGTYPWSVAIYSNRNSTLYNNICGGSLIKTNIVLTAAHCVADEWGVRLDSKYFRVGAGKYFNSFRDTRDDNTAQYAEVVEIAVHKEYKGDIRNFRGDIALLKLKSHFALSKVVQPVCYNNLPPLEVNSIGMVTGWGYTTTTGNPSDVLKELEMPYNDEATCLNYLDRDFTLKYFTGDKMCAGFNDRNASVCKGDSGGGLAIKSSFHPKRYFVHGIVSIGHSFKLNNQVHCNVQRSVLFTNVETYLEWIRLKVRQWNLNEINY